MTPALIIPISILGTVLTVSLFALLLLICTKRRCRKAEFSQQQYQKQDAELVEAAWNTSRSEPGLDGFSPQDDLPEMFLDPDWSGDAENLILHCIDLLKSCHVLTEQLVAHTMESSGTIKSPTEMDKIVTAAKNIRPRVDELVKAMYTPSDSKQIEERSTALYKSVCQLLQVVRSASNRPDTLAWAGEIIVAIEKHMKAMQLECQSVCSSCSSIQSTASSESCLCQQSVVMVTNQAYCYPRNTVVY
ncbi:transmembrane protein 98-like [Stylophora pistillata]|uniref:Transmembrane protein 98 n=1 Tax=Stylophora pistillata TaxID=50429 RepID=A0A2B4SHQ9_STYPI|nr:transmembrane protein 98-like [Stylophora pistillata]PFX28649.1 Transmembrane protein 98 [Stylophora pistillata]